MERLVLAHLRPQVTTSLDPLQFAYRHEVGVEDAIIYLLQRAHSHLNLAGSSISSTTLSPVIYKSSQITQQWWGVSGVEMRHDFNGSFIQDPVPFAADFLFAGHEPCTIVLIVMYLVSFVTGFVGNIMALLVLTRGRNRLTGVSTTRKLLINLAGCDMMVVCVCMPVNLGHQVYSVWVFGDLLCRAVPFIQAVSVSASVLSLAVISLNRYYSVHNPLRVRSVFTGRKIGAMIVAVWIVSSGLCLPLVFMNETKSISLTLDGSHSITVCVEAWSKARLRQGYNFLLFCALYGFPVLFNLIICFLTCLKLWSANDQFTEAGTWASTRSVTRMKTRKKIAKMVLVLVVLFTLSWLPLYVVDIWIDFNMPGSLDKEVLAHVEHGWVLQSRPFAQWLGLTNSALNPLCYCFVGDLYRSAKRFRQSYREKMASVFNTSQKASSSDYSSVKLHSCTSSTKSCRNNESWRSSNVFRDRLNKSKSMSALTVCETVFG
ncbi:gastrin/cholecystokinin type B receptor [Trichomycterus rosablanca]|uniref:gastrin/cholecystokinin type B receptor n=1 Tax=Trichomycterus rosablanca TaxID=2290929 RepID=UPI002F34FB80